MTSSNSNGEALNPIGDVAGARRPLSPLSTRGSVRELLALLGMPSPLAAVDIDGDTMALSRVRQEAALFHEGTQAMSLHVVRTGSLKCTKTLEDGYEQVLSFAQAGDLLGFESLHHGRHPCSAIALEDCTVYTLLTSGLPDLLGRNPMLDEALHCALSRQLACSAETLEMMAAVASDVRLARFLLWLSARMAQAGQSHRRLHLRMARRDIASFLGVAHETVSRSFTTLAENGYITVDNRNIEILDLDKLQKLARYTRSPHSDAAKDVGGAPLATRHCSQPTQPVQALLPGTWFAGPALPERAPVAAALPDLVAAARGKPRGAS